MELIEAQRTVFGMRRRSVDDAGATTHRRRCRRFDSAPSRRRVLIGRHRLDRRRASRPHLRRPIPCDFEM